jgi:UDP-N-acetylmuramoyl-L-alanyl-D-glutamate--2,6-diaminopimelate ligase
MLPRDAPSVLNIDDPAGRRSSRSGGRPLTYGINRPADVMPGPLSYSLEGLDFDVRTPSGPVHVRSNWSAVRTSTTSSRPFRPRWRWRCRPTRSNAAAVARRRPGRFQVVSGASDRVTVVVDYAHTDDALRNLLETARPLATGRLITVFGCGGDRDRTKRPLMGAVASRLSDLIVITSDNPRSEDPNRIIEEVQRGITSDTVREGAPRPLAIADRRDAIAKAIELARPGDVVLIAGKGHEKYQAIGSRVLPFDDVAVAREALGRRAS